MSYAYAVAPIVGWVVAGALKLAINSLRSRTVAVDQIGAGGMPSTHTTVVSSTVVTTAMLSGLDSADFGLALTLAMIVIFDAAGLRSAVGHHAARLNELNPSASPRLRERQGHRPAEILAGVVLGIAVAALTVWLLKSP